MPKLFSLPKNIKKSKSKPTKKLPIFLKILKITAPATTILFCSQFLMAPIIKFILKLIDSSATVPTRLFILIATSSILSLFTIIKLLPLVVKKIKKSNSTPSPHHLDFSTNREELGLSGLFTWVDILLVPAAFIVTMLASSAVIAFFSLFPWFNANQAQEIGITNLYLYKDIVFAGLSIVIIPAIFEEIVFRGWIYGKLRAFLSFWPAALITSIIFGAVHGQLNVAIITAIMSLVACFTREITGTVYASILLHMLKNGIAFYLLFFFSGGVPR